MAEGDSAGPGGEGSRAASKRKGIRPENRTAVIGGLFLIFAAIIGAIATIIGAWHSGGSSSGGQAPQAGATARTSATAPGSATAPANATAPGSATASPRPAPLDPTTAPAGTQPATITRVVIYQGDGNVAVGPAALPTGGQIEISAVPKTIRASGAGTLEMDVASLQGPWGACASDCSEWAFYHNAVQVTSFTIDGETGHALQSVPVNTGWADLGDGTWTPVYLVWQGGCIHLDLDTHDWSAVTPASSCP